MLLNLIKVGSNELINKYTDKGEKMLFGKTKKIQELEARIMNAETIIHDILFNKNTSNDLAKTLISILVSLDREYAEFLLNEYFSMDTGEGYPKNNNTKRRYNVIGPMIRKRLTQIDSKKK